MILVDQMSLLSLIVALFLIVEGHAKSDEETLSPYFRPIYEEPVLSTILKLSHKDIHALWTTNMSTESLFYPLFPLNQPGSQPDPLCHIDHFDGNQSIKITIDLIDGEDDGMQSH